MTPLDLNLLGGMACGCAGGEPLTFPTRKVRALLAYLAASGARSHARGKLAALLWGDRAEADARANLRKALSRLRESLPDEVRGCILADADRIGLRPDGVAVDAHRVGEAGGERRGGHGGPGRYADATVWLRQAAEGDTDDARFAFVYGVALHDTGKTPRGCGSSTAARRHPGDADILRALAAFSQEPGDAAARRWAAALDEACR